MFRSNFLVKNGRYFIPNSLYSHRRDYCQQQIRTKLQEKYYLVECGKPTKTLEASKTDIQKSLIRLVPAHVTRDDWMKVYDAMSDIMRIYRNQMRLKLEKIGFDEAFVNEKKLQGKEILRKTSEKTPVKLKQLKVVGEEQWMIIKESEEFAKFKDLPSNTIKLSKELIVKAHEYWIIFEQSQYKEKLVHILKITYDFGKKGVLEIYKFYKDVIKAPVAKLKH